MTGAPSLRAAADWLALRGTADEEARDRGAAGLLGELTGFLADREVAALQVVDLGAGTGANGRYLQPRLRWPQEWVVVDHDAEHLSHLAHEGAVRVAAGIGQLPGALKDLGRPDGAVRLVTCAALLDVLTEEELAGVAQLVVDSGGPALLSLTVDGRVQWSPHDPADDLVGRVFDRHQQRHGRPGPAAGDVVTRLLTDRSSADGLAVRRAQTDWRLGPGTPRLLRRWLHERMEAVLDEEPDLAADVTDWHRRRTGQLRSGQLQVLVGHTDLLVLPR